LEINKSERNRMPILNTADVTHRKLQNRTMGLIHNTHNNY